MSKTILITGSSGFLGKNLCEHLSQRKGIVLKTFDLENSMDELRRFVGVADIIFHLAGVNRPLQLDDFETGNVGFTQTLLNEISQSGRRPRVIFSSSIQAELDNPYGKSKRSAELLLEDAARKDDIRLSIFRLPNLFGKWSRPNYNAVTSTFCHNIANDLPVQINDPSVILNLAYVDDAVGAFLKEMEKKPYRDRYRHQYIVDQSAIPCKKITVGELAQRIYFFRNMQETLLISDFSDRFNKQLYATYLSYVPKERWEYGTEIKTDDRGNLAELVKSTSFGQMFVSKTKPGITRGNHYHHTKTEKFMVISGEAVIRFRHIHHNEIIEFSVHGDHYRIVDIPPGYTHSITNTGTTELITLFWASEIFDSSQADTYFKPVTL
ncbi:MAG: NAD-dependent epimerase/dehydratase family protein [Planctomycetaceae bacterium]|jgi:UDP-2-acetamido-2,6-beta-L-arabino-hexul-4-ose reductase|nr:NAD-dependent epimerase/dehydratase family protein [Planctomycetaceae bacterium]